MQKEQSVLSSSSLDGKHAGLVSTHTNCQGCQVRSLIITQALVCFENTRRRSRAGAERDDRSGVIEMCFADLQLSSF